MHICGNFQALNQQKRLYRNQDSFILLVILLAAAFLRFYKFWLLDFTHDELSALARLHYDSFSALVENGIKVDGHPAGVQAFLFFWCKIVGYSPLAFKIPFLIIGVINVYLLYLIGKKWFGTTCGHFSAASYAVLQYSIYYAQIARPYDFGIFFTLLAGFGWTQFLFPDNSKPVATAPFIYLIGIVGAAYSHHFSAFAALLIAVSGLFFLNRKNVIRYLLINLLAVLSYLPHLPITLAQLKIGGIGGPEGWLGKPEPTFLFHYFSYLFHFSWLFFGVVILAAITGFFFTRKPTAKIQWRILPAAWFLVTFFTAYLYSQELNPLLQYSTLSFVFPFLLPALFSFRGELTIGVKIPALLLILLIGSYSLTQERRHYEMMFNQPFDYFGKTSTEILQAYPAKKYLAVSNFGAYLMEPTRQGYPDFKFLVKENDLSFTHLNTLVDREQPEILLLQNLDPAYLEVLRYRYPYCIKKYFGFGFEYYALSSFKPKLPVDSDVNFYSCSKLNGNEPNYSYTAERVQSDSTGNKFIEMNPDQEFGFGFSAKVGELISKDNTILTAEISYQADTSFQNALFVMSIDAPDTNLFWSGKELKPFFINRTGWNRAAIATPLLNALDFPKETKISFYIWNKDKQHLLLKDLEIKIYPGNDRVYGLIQQFKSN